MAQLLEDGVLEIGAIHTYVELYARLFVDLSPNVVLVCAEQADSEGNLYTGPGTEDTPVIVEAAAFHDAIVIVQVKPVLSKSFRGSTFPLRGSMLSSRPTAPSQSSHFSLAIPGRSTIFRFSSA